MRTTLLNDKERVLTCIKEGMTTGASIANHLNLEVIDYDGHHANWYVWILLHMLNDSGKIVKCGKGKFKIKTDSAPIIKCGSNLSLMLENELKKELER